MQKVYSFIFSKKGLLFFLTLFGIAYLATFINRYIQSDENWFGEEAYWLLNEGVVRLKSLPLSLDFDKRVYVYYKLLIYSGTGLTYLFGWSIWPLKIFIFMLFVIFLYLFNNWLKSDSINFSSHQRFIAYFFLITTPIMIDQTFIFRPEIPMMLVIFLSFLYLRKGLKEEKIRHIGLGGLFAGISFLIHLNGNAVVIAGFIYVLSYRKYKYLLLYSAASGITCLLYFFDLTDPASFKAFIYQLRNWPLEGYAHSSNTVFGYILSKINSLLAEHQRFFWSERVTSTSIIFFTCLIFGFKKFKKEYPEILRYFLIMAISMILFGGFAAERYLIYYLPFMAIIISYTIFYYIENRNSVFSGLLIFFIIGHLIVITLRFNAIFATNYNHNKVHAIILNQIPEKSRILAPWEFIFNGIEKYQIFSYKNIEYYNYKKIEKGIAVRIIEKLKIDYIIASERFDDFINISLDDVGKNGFYIYKPIYSDGRFIVLKKDYSDY